MSMTDLILLSPSEWLKPALRFCLSKHSMSMSSLVLFVVQMTNGICFETLWNVSQNFKAWQEESRNPHVASTLKRGLARSQNRMPRMPDGNWDRGVSQSFAKFHNSKAAACPKFLNPLQKVLLALH